MTLFSITAQSARDITLKGGGFICSRSHWVLLSGSQAAQCIMADICDRESLFASLQLESQRNKKETRMGRVSKHHQRVSGMLLMLGFCLLGLPLAPNYNTSRLTHRFVSLLLLWTIFCPLPLFPCCTSFSRCPTFCVKSLNVLRSSALCSASRHVTLALLIHLSENSLQKKKKKTP